MTRTSSWLFILSLALAAAGAVEAKQSKVCTTVFVNRKGTRTHKAADQTTTIIKAGKLCTSTAKAVTTPKARTVTSVYPAYTTRVVDLPQETDVFTSTKWSFDFVYPTTTVTEVTTPTVTEMRVLPNLDPPVVVTTTSYTLVAPPPAGPQRRDTDLQALELRASKKKPTYLGKDIYCHTEKTITTSLAKRPCKTITTTSKAPRKTFTSNVPLSITVTRTRVPVDATRIEYEVQQSTITAPLSTKSVTVVGPALTEYSIETAAPATVTQIVPEYEVCRPTRYAPADNFSGGDFEGAIVATDVAACCHAVASVPGAVNFGFFTSSGSCEFGYAISSDSCPSNIIIPRISFNPDNAGLIAGPLQCYGRG